MLRPDWSRTSPSLAAVYHDQHVRIELETARGVLFSGRWELTVRRNGQTLAPSCEWSEVCWYSDNEIDYLELEIELDQGVRVERSLALARRDGIAVLADAVLAAAPARLEYAASLPLTARFAPAHETREGHLTAARPAALVLPMALGEWRADCRPGELVERDGRLVLSQSQSGGGLFAPLFFDLRPERFHGQPLTWRQLTVAQDRRIISPDAAAGYRVMVGREQWLFYRTLTPPANRTLLGHNLVTQLLLARFRKTGEVETLVEIE